MLLAYAAGRLAGWLRPVRQANRPMPSTPLQPGISVVIPSRNGKDLLAAQLSGIARDLDAARSEIVVVDNGSSDGTAEWLPRQPLDIPVVVEISDAPLGFARAVNRGIARARYSHVCLLNNDMRIEPGFFAALRRAFDVEPGLFCATAQIRFPPGVRREETGKAVMRQDAPDDFPIRCDEPLPGEDLTWVLYGSGGCSAYNTEKLRELGGMDEAYDPAYVEDLDLGYRAWLRLWPTVYVAGAVVEHRHRATTSRYYTVEQLSHILEINYLKFLARAVAGRAVFGRLWAQALSRLRRLRHPALLQAARIARAGGPAPRRASEEELLLALTGGSVACFPGGAKTRGSVVAGELSAALPEGSVLVAPVDELKTPPPELLAVCAEVVLVRRSAPLAFRAALEQSRRRAQL
jgi:GT2 family glycosyltransferase